MPETRSKGARQVPLRLSAARVTWGLFPLVLTAAYAWLIVTLENPDYLNNDDLAIQSIADGSLTGEPESTLVFPSRYLGQITRFLYLNFPGHFWYQDLLMVTYILSFVFAWFLLGRSEDGRHFWIIIFFGFFPLFATHPNFTSAAVAAAGVASLTLGYKLASQTLTLTSIPVFLLLVIGLSWRPTIGVIVAILALLFGLGLRPLKFRESQLKFGREKLAQLFWLYPPAIIALIAGILSIPQASFPLNPDREWGRFFSYNRQRSAYLDYLSSFDKASVTEVLDSNPHEDRFNAWLGSDSTLFGADALPQTLEVGESRATEFIIRLVEGLLKFKYESFVANLTNPSVIAIVCFFLVAILAFALLKSDTPSSIQAWQSAGKFSISSLSFLLILALLRLTTGVALGALFVILLGLATFLIVDRDFGGLRRPNVVEDIDLKEDSGLASSAVDNFSRWISYLQKQAIIILVTVGIWSPLHWLVSHEELGPSNFQAREEGQIQAFRDWTNNEILESDLYITGPGITTSRLASLPWSSTGYSVPENLIPGGWFTMSPYWFDRLDRVGLDSGNIDAAFLDGRLRFVGSDFHASIISRSLEVRGFGRVTPRLISSSLFDGSLGVFGFESSPRAETLPKVSYRQ